jgi:hypothetical protein
MNNLKKIIKLHFIFKKFELTSFGWTFGYNQKQNQNYHNQDNIWKSHRITKATNVVIVFKDDTIKENVLYVPTTLKKIKKL